MVTGASTADVAVILIDARKGVLTQTRRHSYLVSLLGIRHVVLAVNKLDLVGYSSEVFERIDDEYRAVRARASASSAFVAIPMSALQRRQHHRSRAPNTPWYDGPDADGVPRDGRDRRRRPRSAAVSHAGAVGQSAEPRFSRLFGPHRRRRRAAAATGVRVLPSGRESTVARIVTHDGDLDVAVAGQSVTLTLADEIDVSRGDVLARRRSRCPAVADQFEATSSG